MRYLTIILLFVSSLAMAQRPYLFPTISDASSNTYIGIGAYVQTQGYSASGDGGGALYRMTAIGSAPMAADSGYVYPVTATKVLVQVLEDEYLRTATYGVVCGSSAEATNNYNRLQRFFTAINTLDKQAFVNGCNDTIYVNFTSALTTTLNSHDKFVMRGEGTDVTRIKATAGSIDFGFSDAAKVNLFDLYLDGYDATAFGGIGGADQSLTYVNDTLTISGGNYVVITGGGGGGTDDQTLSIDSNASTFTLAIESGNSVQFSKTANTDDQAISLDSTATSYTATVEDGGSITWAKVTDTDTDNQTLSVDSTAYKYSITIADGNAIDFGKSQDNSATNELQAITLDSVAGTYNLNLSNGGGTVKIKRDTDTDDQTLSFSSPNLSISEGNTVDLSALQDGTGTDDQSLTLDSVSGTYNLTIESGNTVKIKRDTDTDDQTLSIDSNATTYTLTIVDGNNVKFAKGGGGGGGTPGGTHNDLQINRSGSFSGTDSLEWVGASGYLKVTGRIEQTFGVTSTALGEGALANDDLSSNSNVAIGYFAGNDLTTQAGNIFIGAYAGENATGQSNHAIGLFALRNNTGSNNFGIGGSSLSSGTGSDVVAVGASAFQSATSLRRAVAIGSQAGLSNTTGNENTCIGYQAMSANTTGANNVVIGSQAAKSFTGGNNTIIGSYSLWSATSLTSCASLGNNAGRYYGSGSDANLTATSSVYLGTDSRASASGNTNEIVIGTSAIGNGSNTATIGSSSTTNVYLNGTTRSSGAYIGRVTTFNSTPSQTTFGAYICHVDYTTTGAFSLVIDTDNLVSGYTLIIKDVDGNAGANNITISTEGAETIDGSSTYVISTNYGSVQLYSDGVNWYTF